MISTAVVGTKAGAASWSPSEEERRKALFAYLGAGLALLLWDNIPLGAAIGCPSIERALTADVYVDRVLGETRQLAVPAYTVQTFTGNNITPRGDLSSRSLTARIAVDRPDPENREFKNADPIAWTERNRLDILAALYTIMLGNPRFRDLKANAPAETRFKTWWHLVGAAVEHAARCYGKEISFKKLFVSAVRDDDQTTSLTELLTELYRLYRTGTFRANAIAERCRAMDMNEITFKTTLEAASGRPIPVASVQAVSGRLRSCLDRPVIVGTEMLALRYSSEHQGGWFRVTATPAGDAL